MSENKIRMYLLREKIMVTQRGVSEPLYKTVFSFLGIDESELVKGENDWIGEDVYFVYRKPSEKFSVVNIYAENKKSIMQKLQDAEREGALI